MDEATTTTGSDAPASGSPPPLAPDPNGDPRAGSGAAPAGVGTVAETDDAPAGDTATDDPVIMPSVEDDEITVFEEPEIEADAPEVDAGTPVAGAGPEAGSEAETLDPVGSPLGGGGTESGTSTSGDAESDTLEAPGTTPPAGTDPSAAVESAAGILRRRQLRSQQRPVSRRRVRFGTPTPRRTPSRSR